MEFHLVGDVMPLQPVIFCRRYDMGTTTRSAIYDVVSMHAQCVFFDAVAQIFASVHLIILIGN